MFSKAILLVAASFALLAAASPVPDNNNSCNTGSMQCCNSLEDSDAFSVKKAASLLNLDLTGATGKVGLQCSPITAVGVGSGSSCNQQPVCCSGNNFNGLVVVGCSPIIINM